MTENEMTVLELDPVETLTLADVFYVIQGFGENRDRYCTLLQLRDFFQSNMSYFLFSSSNRAIAIDSERILITGADGRVIINQEGLQILNADKTVTATFKFDAYNVLNILGSESGNQKVKFKTIEADVIDLTKLVDRSGNLKTNYLNYSRIIASDAQMMSTPFTFNASGSSDYYDLQLFGSDFKTLGKYAGAYVVGPVNSASGATAATFILKRPAKQTGEIILVHNAGEIVLNLRGDSSSNTVCSVNVPAGSVYQLYGYVKNGITNWIKIG